MEQKKELKILAQANLAALTENLYPGRGIILGMDTSGKFLVQVYWIMGRSENSRNRVFIIDSDGKLKTAPADPEKVKDPSLIIYTAMADNYQSYAVSNGAQTEDVLSRDGLKTLTKNNWQYEPDKPNFTPRITGLFRLRLFGTPVAEFSILKKSPSSDLCEESLYEVLLTEPGIGCCVTTYDGDGDPLPSFSGKPYILPLEGDINNVAKTIWDALDEDNRVSLAVKFIGFKVQETKLQIINRYSKKYL